MTRCNSCSHSCWELVQSPTWPSCSAQSRIHSSTWPPAYRSLAALTTMTQMTVSLLKMESVQKKVRITLRNYCTYEIIGWELKLILIHQVDGEEKDSNPGDDDGEGMRGDNGEEINEDNDDNDLSDDDEDATLYEVRPCYYQYLSCFVILHTLYHHCLYIYCLILSCVRGLYCLVSVDLQPCSLLLLLSTVPSLFYSSPHPTQTCNSYPHPLWFCIILLTPCLDPLFPYVMQIDSQRQIQRGCAPLLLDPGSTLDYYSNYAL